jgi:predicted dehydrogenase
MLRIGVLGAGHLGKIHIRLLKESEAFQLVGFYDPDQAKSAAVAAEFGVKSFASQDSLMNEIDVVDIVTTTSMHYECALDAIKRRKHFFIEKPVTQTIDEAHDLIEKAKKAGLTGQVGHVERFNPAFMKAQEYGLDPLFIESHRLAEFKPRGTDVSVVLDVMIHDIDILLSMVKAEISQVSASGVAIVSDTVDIANARIEFENGCVANLTASRISLKTERKIRIFQKNAYITIDFGKKELNVFKLKELGPDEEPSSFMVIDPGDGKPRKEIFYDQPKPPEVNAIQLELALFAEAIQKGTTPVVPLEDGYRSMMLAQQITEKIEELNKKASKYHKV